MNDVITVFVFCLFCLPKKYTIESPKSGKEETLMRNIIRKIVDTIKTFFKGKGGTYMTKTNTTPTPVTPKKSIMVLSP